MTNLDDSMRLPKTQHGDATTQITQPSTLAPYAAQALPTPSAGQARLGIIASIDPRGRHEFLRLAAGLAPQLHGPTGDTIVEAITGMGIEPARIERVVTSLKEVGVIALVDGVLYALGRRNFLEDIGIRPHLAELRLAERIERSGDVAYFVVAVARANCLGVLGAPSSSDALDIIQGH